MPEHFHSTKCLNQVQRLYHRIHCEVYNAYRWIVPLKIMKRRNLKYQKQKDTVIITIHVMGKMLGFTSERMWHSFIKENLFANKPFPERSRYHRCCQQLLSIIKRIRNWLLKRFLKNTAFTIVDSIPLPLCHPARNRRAKRLGEIASIGYCASKNQYYYGLKGSFQVTDQGFIVSYVISSSHVHDITVLEELIEQAPYPYTLADKGYVSEVLRKKVKDTLGVCFLAQPRNNSKIAFPTALSKLIRKHRKQIETLFSGLIEGLHLNHIRAMCLNGFELSLEGILLAHTLLVHWSITSGSNGTRWKGWILN
jgi:hypothetical protein